MIPTCIFLRKLQPLFLEIVAMCHASMGPTTSAGLGFKPLSMEEMRSSPSLFFAYWKAWMVQRPGSIVVFSVT